MGGDFLKKSVIIFTLLFLFIRADISHADVDVSAASAIVIDASSNRVLYEKDAYTRRGMASTTKIMTAILAIENLDMNDIVTVSPFASETEGSSIWLSPGEHMSVEDLLYGLMLASGNDAAAALAEYTAGGVDSFTLLMNEKAKEIGCRCTSFTNPHGLPDENHYTTAYDLALIASYAMKNSVFKEIVSTKNKVISWEGSEWDRSLSNHNKLLNMYDGCVGIKTGFTKKDGRCLVSCAERNGITLITVTLSAPDDWNDHMSLMDYCFDTYSPYTVCEKGESAGTYKTEGTDKEEIKLYYGDGFTAAITADEESKISRKAVFDVKYPIKKGQKVGRLDIYYDGALIGSVDILSAENASVKQTVFGTMQNLFKGIIKR